VKRYYGRDSAVVYGAVYTDRFKFIGNGDFWLSVNRLIPHKRVELQLEVFRRLPKEKLVIVGCFEKSKHFIETERRIRASKPDNVTLLSYVSQGELERLYGECKGFIATALDEDMGLTPIEAMAAGKPVVAVNEGGYRETVVDGVTGRLVSADVDALVDAVKEVSANSERFKSACEERAREFDVNVFKVRMRALLDKCVGLGGNEGRSTL
jgi:glycosyltransferase involved in cell wall biosynthesis